MFEYFTLAAGCLAFGAVVQATLGFGMGVVAIPLMVWGGLELPVAIGVLLPNVLFQTGWSCLRSRRSLPWKDVGVVVGFRFIGLPIGILLLGLVAEQGQAYSRGLLGFGLLVTLGVQRSSFRGGAEQRGNAAAYALVSGVFAGLIGMGGPALVLWVMRQDWRPDRQRAFLWLSFFLATPVQIGMMLGRFGSEWITSLQLGACCIPLVIALAEFVGRLTKDWSRERLRSAMQVFLLLIAVRLVIQFVTDAFLSAA